MAYGNIVVIPSGQHKQTYVPSGMQFPSLAILNPNDGVLYVATNRDVVDIGTTASWDWKIPSQSYALLPGTPEWQSVGMFFLDQSGAGRQGEFTLYPINQKTVVPVFQAIGRALQALATSLDINEGALPANPSVGVLRLWATVTNALHALDSNGVDHFLFDATTALGGGLLGTLPNPALNVTSAVPASNTTMAVASTYYDMVVANVVPGTYLLLASATVSQVGTAGNIHLRITNSVLAELARTLETLGIFSFGSLDIVKLLTFAGNETIHMQAQSDIAGATAYGGDLSALSLLRIS